MAQKPRPPCTTVWLPILRKDRLEWAVEKLTEVGCTAIQFYGAQRSRPGKVDLDRLFRIRDESERQCKRYFSMDIYDMLPKGLSSLESRRNGNGKAMSIWFDVDSKNSLRDFRKKTPQGDSHDHNFNLIIGPEGGFSHEEREILSHECEMSVQLEGCEYVLKADTAAVSAVLLVRGAVGWDVSREENT